MDLEQPAPIRDLGHRAGPLFVKGRVLCPRKEGQKLKLLVLLQILARGNDERHPLSVPQIVGKIQRKGIEAERKRASTWHLNTLNEDADFPMRS